jgi:hypothetical protein
VARADRTARCQIGALFGGSWHNLDKNIAFWDVLMRAANRPVLTRHCWNWNRR